MILGFAIHPVSRWPIGNALPIRYF